MTKEQREKRKRKIETAVLELRSPNGSRWALAFEGTRALLMAVNETGAMVDSNVDALETAEVEELLGLGWRLEKGERREQ